jgi:hypothetical protein
MCRGTPCEMDSDLCYVAGALGKTRRAHGNERLLVQLGIQQHW